MQTRPSAITRFFASSGDSKNAENVGNTATRNVAVSLPRRTSRSMQKAVFALLAVAALVMSAGSIATAQEAEPDPPRFLPAVNSAVGNNPAGVDTGDFDEDGVLDLVVANYQSGELTLLLGSGQGVFGPRDAYPVPENPYGVVTADFNDDGNLDAAVSDRGQNLVTVFEGSGTGYFNAPN